MVFTLKEVKVGDILDINYLNIPTGQITCIVGESGSGKTTLLRLLNHLISCDQGLILVNDVPMSQLNPIELRRKVTMLSQTPAIFNGSVKKNLLIGLQFSEKPYVSEEILKEIMEKVRLEKDINQDASLLSGGEKQRLALARVLLMNPDVLLLDEPSSALDEETTTVVMEQLVAYVKNQHKTLVMVTHSKAVVEAFSENVIKIHKGKVITKEVDGE